MPRYRSALPAVLAIVPALLLSLTPGQSAPRQRLPDHSVSGGSKPAAPAWTLVHAAHFGPAGNTSGYTTVLMAGRRAWVFGGTNPGGPGAPVAANLTSKGWTVSALPRGLSQFVSDASATSANDIWAVSISGRYALHWDGTRWRLARTWTRGALSDVLALSPQDVYVFGTNGSGVRSPGTWRYLGHSWRPVMGLAADIYRASEITRHDIWAIAAGPRTDSVLHFDWRGWHRLALTPALQSIRWHDILASASNSVWLVGDTPGSSGRLVLAHWNGEHWTKLLTTLRAWPGQLAAAGPDRVLATGTSAGLVTAGLVVQVTRQGRLTWSTISSTYGSGASDVAYDSHTRELLASGGLLTKLGGDAAIWMRRLPPVAIPAAADVS